MKINKIIVLDDELIIRKSLQEQLRKRRYCVASCSTLAQVRSLLEKDHFDLVFADMCLPDGQGMELLSHTRANSPRVVMMTGHGSVECAVKCMQMGAFDYILKPFSVESIELILKKAESAPEKNSLAIKASEGQGSPLIGESSCMLQLKALIGKVSATEATVMITGENGTGKEEVSNEIHRLSSLNQKPFIKINCAALSENLIESELFGHEKGSFTGANQAREGRFESANHGTLLLDEIGEISPRIQAKLLRVLQEHQFERVGGNKTLNVQVRLIASTNKDLQKAVECGEFREDLYYRLNVFPIQVPPLRQRGQDILILAEHFLHEYANKYNKIILGFTDEVREALLQYPWPGNVRQLQNALSRAIILSEEGKKMDLLTLALTHPQNAHDSCPIKSLEALERDHILSVLSQSGGSLEKAADLLKINTRVLRNKLKLYQAV